MKSMLSFVFIKGPVEHSEKAFKVEVFRQGPVYNLSFISCSAQHIAFHFQ